VSAVVRADLTTEVVNVRPVGYTATVDMPEVVARVGVIAGDVGLLNRIKAAAADSADFEDFRARIAAL
jgi:hypothetical protein